MRYPTTPLPATLVERPNRFLAIVQLNGTPTPCHLPNPGRMVELMTPGKRVYLLPRQGEGRKTRYDLVLVDHDGVLVSVDSRAPNKLIAEALERGALEPFQGLRLEKAEPAVGSRRLDLLLTNKRGRVYVEAKSCTLVRGGVALFPDAPTKRRVHHMEAMLGLAPKARAAVVFVVQRPDAHQFQPNDETDPQFAKSLRKAVAAGVEAYAYKCRVTLEGVEVQDSVPVRLNG